MSDERRVKAAESSWTAAGNSRGWVVPRAPSSCRPEGLKYVVPTMIVRAVCRSMRLWYAVLMFLIVYLLALVLFTLPLSSFLSPSLKPISHRQSPEKSSGGVRLLNKPGKNLIEEVTLPSSWNTSLDLLHRLEARRQHLRQMCSKEGLDQPTKDYQINAWEFLINREFGLVWCNVFKAASSTWLWNFNLLAGYTEKQLLKSNDSPIQLARRKYPRPSVAELQEVMNGDTPPLSFMITRHPFLRLVSAYRNKILSGNEIYRNVMKGILIKYKHLGPPVPMKVTNGKRPPKGAVSPSFSQFVQWVLDEAASGRPLDMHWIPQTTFCTPCLVDFAVLAKMETLEEDGNYIIFTSGINQVIQPKRINRSTGESTEEAAMWFLCQLSTSQIDALLVLYRLDLLLFDYDASIFHNCTSST
ncbi:carbohydrate sulfotransferase 11 isoform X1 [Procambarus clarkii]|uniref:carbohydrate sulfotransferase 11 isoform X1 n=1 Tax=Procambarus clarkii TaxID=6728 RepID=UPI0037445E32